MTDQDRKTKSAFEALQDLARALGAPEEKTNWLVDRLTVLKNEGFSWDERDRIVREEMQSKPWIRTPRDL